MVVFLAHALPVAQGRRDQVVDELCVHPRSVTARLGEARRRGGRGGQRRAAEVARVRVGGVVEQRGELHLIRVRVRVRVVVRVRVRVRVNSAARQRLLSSEGSSTWLG